MEFPSDQRLDLLRCGRWNICKAIHNGVHRTISSLLSIRSWSNLLCLSNDKGEIKSKFFVIIKLEYENRRRSWRRRLRVLNMSATLCVIDAGCSTCTYSTMLLSPRSRLAVTLVAGKAFGCTFKIVRLRELVTDSDEIVTNRASLLVCMLYVHADNTNIESDPSDTARRPHQACCLRFPSFRYLCFL